jgi:hypothetical protein
VREWKKELKKVNIQIKLIELKKDGGEVKV